jgi:hypothetical protein
MPHTFQVLSSSPGKKSSRLPREERRATPELVAVIAESNQMEVVGPVPEAYLRRD